MKEKCRKLLIASDHATPGQGDKIHKRNIYHSDGAKYMSYLKVRFLWYFLVGIQCFTFIAGFT